MRIIFLGDSITAGAGAGTVENMYTAQIEKLTGAEVIADDRLHALCEALDRNNSKLHYTLKNGHGTHIQIASINGKAAV